MAKGDVLVRMKADVSNYDANIAKARKTLDGFKQDNLTMGGILNQSTKSLVAAAAQYASFAAVIGTVASGFAEATSKGIAMAREAEGVSKAFERLNKPGLLDNLREATHNTINDLELMKQAVKFDNFNLSLEQMGTFLAFAQQQAKDTGQDVNYLVDSIVTGLGRKSLPILDNLGLSATEIRERMKETGDMTQAVADIIQERMEAAGGYVETAADRAAQAQARLDNAMKELGDTMNSLSGSGATLWSELEIGAVNLANNTIKPLIKLFNELAKYIQGTSVEDILTNGMTDVTDTVDDNGKLIKKNAINNIPEIVVSGNAPKKTKRPRGGGGKTEVVYAEGSIAAQAKLVSDLQKKWNEAGEEMKRGYLYQLVEAEQKLKSMKESDAFNKKGIELLYSMKNGEGASPAGIADGLMPDIKKIEEELAKNPIKLNIEIDPEKIKSIRSMAALQKTASDTAKVVGSIGEAFNAIEDPAAKVAGTVAQAIANIALGYSQAMLTPKDPISWIAFGAAGLAQMLAMMNAIHSSTGYAQGGIVKGNSYSGDNIYGGPDAMVNAGELVLTKAQQGNLASQLQGAGFGGVNMVGEISGEAIKIVLNRHLKRTGQGEIVTW